MRTVVLRRHVAGLNAGEVAGYSEVEAAKLVKAGAAVYFDKEARADPVVARVAFEAPPEETAAPAEPVAADPEPETTESRFVPRRRRKKLADD